MIPSSISILSGLIAFILAVVLVVRNPRVFHQWLFAAGFGLLGVGALFVGAVLRHSAANEVATWQLYRLLATSFVPSVWLAISLSLARANYRAFLLRWKWIVVALAILGPALVLFSNSHLFVNTEAGESSRQNVVDLGLSGYLLYIVLLVSNVLILANLERTFRNATGHLRWQIKFMVLGLAVIFGVRIYTDSQTVLFSMLNPSLEFLNSLALLLGCVLVTVSLFRANIPEFEVYLSQSFIRSSLTIVSVGVYLVTVALVAALAYRSDGGNLPAVAFLVLIAVVALAILFLSDKVRYKRKQFVSRHFRKPLHDYRKVWSEFTENTNSLTNARDLCRVVSTLISRTLDINAISMFIYDAHGERPTLIYSTVFLEKELGTFDLAEEAGIDIAEIMAHRVSVVDLAFDDPDLTDRVKRAHPGYLEKARIRYCIPLRSNEKMIGMMTLGNRVMNQALRFEDRELLSTIADQAARALLNIRLTERVQQTKELEAFQAMSAFFMHDLKNLASRLSFVAQNMPLHYGNVEFREDAIGTISKSVEGIKNVCTKLTLLSSTLDFDFAETDINVLIESTVTDMTRRMKCQVRTVLAEMPSVLIDREQLRKVFENLLINANEAIQEKGQIIVTTSLQNAHLVVTFSDDGCGMSREFMEEYLFKPFKTTKKQGMGIGLFHCKTIVEAHGGKIEVASKQGRGTSFRVLLPVKM
jgi:putative PEP-CTERM system histidine kinase